MMQRFLSIIGILLALLGALVVPPVLTRRAGKRVLGIYSVNPDEDDTPWDLSGYVPAGVWTKLDTRLVRGWRFVRKTDL